MKLGRGTHTPSSSPIVACGSLAENKSFLRTWLQTHHGWVRVSGELHEAYCTAGQAQKRVRRTREAMQIHAKRMRFGADRHWSTAKPITGVEERNGDPILKGLSNEFSFFAGGVGRVEPRLSSLSFWWRLELAPLCSAFYLSKQEEKRIFKLRGLSSPKGLCTAWPSFETRPRLNPSHQFHGL